MFHILKVSLKEWLESNIYNKYAYKDDILAQKDT